MERKLLKTGIYSFVVGLMLGLFIFRGYTAYHDGHYTVTTYDSLDQYILLLLRFSAACSILAMIIAGFDQRNELLKSNKDDSLSFFKLLCVTCCVAIASYWIVIALY